MRPETQDWLRRLETLGQEARQLIGRGFEPVAAAKRMAHQACEPRDEIDFPKLAADLNLVPRRGNTLEGFGAEIEVFVFAYHCLTKDVLSDQAA